MDEDSAKTAQIKIKLSPNLRDWLKVQAVANHRSLLGEIAARLEQSKAQQQPQGAMQ